MKFKLNETCNNGPECPCIRVPHEVRDAVENACLTFDDPIAYNHLDGCYLTNVRGMTVGIELDGYIHS